ncbi:hypothetical protein Anapl_09738 [Anas platyrhynchos]|uniref:Uncharacterized protein n=1 Tax=Anas platyrhynchos TaxID=8839 RepID=R0L024_ANAPL|nr:hypothetical protein Anapl_09738 [Anas platyrhynchos]
MSHQRSALQKQLTRASCCVSEDGLTGLCRLATKVQEGSSASAISAHAGADASACAWGRRTVWDVEALQRITTEDLTSSTSCKFLIAEDVERNVFVNALNEPNLDQLRAVGRNGKHSPCFQESILSAAIHLQNPDLPTGLPRHVGLLLLAYGVDTQLYDRNNDSEGCVSLGHLCAQGTPPSPFATPLEQGASKRRYPGVHPHACAPLVHLVCLGQTTPKVQQSIAQSRRFILLQLGHRHPGANPPACDMLFHPSRASGFLAVNKLFPNSAERRRDPLPRNDHLFFWQPAGEKSLAVPDAGNKPPAVTRRKTRAEEVNKSVQASVTFQSISDEATLAGFLTQEKTQGGPVYKILCEGRVQAVTEGQFCSVSFKRSACTPEPRLLLGFQCRELIFKPKTWQQEPCSGLLQPLVLTPIKKRCVIKMEQEKGNDINRAVRLHTFLYVYGYKLWFVTTGFLARSGKRLQSKFPRELTRYFRCRDVADVQLPKTPLRFRAVVVGAVPGHCVWECLLPVFSAVRGRRGAGAVFGLPAARCLHPSAKHGSPEEAHASFQLDIAPDKQIPGAARKPDVFPDHLQLIWCGAGDGCEGVSWRLQVPCCSRRPLSAGKEMDPATAVGNSRAAPGDTAQPNKWLSLATLGRTCFPVVTLAAFSSPAVHCLFTNAAFTFFPVPSGICCLEDDFLAFCLIGSFRQA